jgi:DNA-binding NtrC family response regulator
MERFTSVTHHAPGARTGFGAAGGQDFLDEDILRAARADAPILISGPVEAAGATARRIHRAGRTPGGRFVSVDCRGSAKAVLERIVEALGEPNPWMDRRDAPGTLYLKHVCALPLPAQQLLANLLLYRGHTRVIASTSCRLLDRVNAQAFDDCLFYRLNVIHLSVGNMAAGV